MKAKDSTILIVPGFEPAGEGIWYNRWASRIQTARVVPPPSSPDNRDDRLAQLVEEVGNSDRPVVMIGHGLGTISILDLAGISAAKPVAAFLVSIPDVQDPSRMATLTGGAAYLGALPETPLDFPTIVIASRQDPCGNFTRVKTLAGLWGAQFVDAGDAGAIDEASGHGPWPEASLTFASMMQKL